MSKLAYMKQSMEIFDIFSPKGDIKLLPVVAYAISKHKEFLKQRDRWKKRKWYICIFLWK